MSDYLPDNGLEESFQSAYKCFHSTETALLKVQYDILCEIDNQKCIVLLLLDMSAAFDTVDHELLLERMSKHYGVKGNALNLFGSYIHNQKQFVIITGIKSRRTPICCSPAISSRTDPVIAIHVACQGHN